MRNVPGGHQHSRTPPIVHSSPARGDTAAAAPAGHYRIVTDENDGRTWLVTPDYRRVAAFRKPAVDPKPSLFSGWLPGGTKLVEALRVGRGKLRWPTADA